jgi:hypothetical protein
MLFADGPAGPVVEALRGYRISQVKDAPMCVGRRSKDRLWPTPLLRGRAIEAIAVEGSKEELIVIHAMALCKRYRDQDEEARRWRL